jgi:hypothetical protein
VAAVGLGASLAAGLATVAIASFTSTSSPVAQTVATASLAPPTGLTATCVPLSSNVTLTWTATTSQAATGYAVLRSTTILGPYSQIGTVTGRATTSFTTTIAVLQTYYYVVEATRNNWTSTTSNQSGVQATGLGVCTSL